MTNAPLHETLRGLPSVNRLLDRVEVRNAISRYGRVTVVETVRRALDRVREELSGAPERPAPSPAALAQTILGDLARQEQPTLRRVINATGIVLHTGLGRAPLAAEALQAIQSVGGYCNLETDLDSGRRSYRVDNVRSLLCEVTGAEAATVVNNNAAATLLVLRALAAHREVIVSRGQLVEIGGSFRLPEVMAVSGALLREVGTTNRTHLRDYEQALSENTAVLLRVHTSNYRIVGFTHQVPLTELVALGRRAGVRVVDDLGSGALFDVSPVTGAPEPVVSESLAAGADVVLFSGDKLLGGPQAGVILGNQECIERIDRDPMMRAVRVDKLMLAALEATLRLHRDPDLARHRIPVYQLLTQSETELRRRARSLHRRLRKALPESACRVVATDSYVGGGSAPTQTLPSFAVALQPPGSVQDFARRLRLGRPAVFPRIEKDRVLFDLRTVRPGEESELAAAVIACLES